MSSATELDLAIQQIDDLLTKLQATAPEATPSRANEPNTNSKDSGRYPVEMLRRLTTCQQMHVAYRRGCACKTSQRKVSRCASYTKQWQFSCNIEQQH